MLKRVSVAGLMPLLLSLPASSERAPGALVPGGADVEGFGDSDEGEPALSDGAAAAGAGPGERTAALGGGGAAAGAGKETPNWMA